MCPGTREQLSSHCIEQEENSHDRECKTYCPAACFQNQNNQNNCKDFICSADPLRRIPQNLVINRNEISGADQAKNATYNVINRHMIHCYALFDRLADINHSKYEEQVHASLNDIREYAKTCRINLKKHQCDRHERNEVFPESIKFSHVISP